MANHHKVTDIVHSLTAEKGAASKVADWNEVEVSFKY
jgi:hypothetical protein